MRQNQKVKRQVFASYETPSVVIKIPSVYRKRDLLSIGDGIFPASQPVTWLTSLTNSKRSLLNDNFIQI